jgi:hypothetical protein
LKPAWFARNGKLRNHHLRKIARAIFDQCRDPHDQLLGIAVQVVGVYLGTEWVMRHIMTDKAGFLYVDPVSSKPTDLRVIELAEMLFNLQDVSGFESVLKELATRQVESSFAVLEVAKILLINHATFRFVPPIGVGGSDYDIEIDHKGRALNAEVKCKIVSSGVSVSGIVNRLVRARSQLPRGLPGVILVRVPASWVGTDLLSGSFKQATTEILSNRYIASS